MTFHDVQFPTDIAYGSRGGPGFMTNIIQTEGGAEYRYPRWESARRRYDVGYGLRDIDDVYAVYDFFLVRMGALYGFRFKDWLDYSSADDGHSTPANSDQVIGTGDGSEQDFQLIKTYGSGATTYVRNIQKPVDDGTMTVSVNGVSKTEGSDYDVDYDTGIITIDTAPTAGHQVVAGYTFDVPCRFGDSADKALEAAYTNFQEGAITGLEIVELKDETPSHEWMNYGGAKDWGSITSNKTISDSTFCHRVIPSDTGLKFTLRDPATVSGGGPHHCIYNDGSNAISVYDDTTLIESIPAGGKAMFVVGIDSSGDNEWWAA